MLLLLPLKISYPDWWAIQFWMQQIYWSEKGDVRAGRGLTLFISNEEMNGIIKIIKSREDLCVLTDGVT